MALPQLVHSTAKSQLSSRQLEDHGEVIHCLRLHLLRPIASRVLINPILVHHQLRRQIAHELKSLATFKERNPLDDLSHTCTTTCVTTPPSLHAFSAPPFRIRSPLLAYLTCPAAHGRRLAPRDKIRRLAHPAP
jgi:hypothetical protein